MKSFVGAVALLVGTLAPQLAVSAPPGTAAQRDLLELLEVRQDSGEGAGDSGGGSGGGARGPTCNTPSNRACWSPGFDINTDYEVNTPFTGVTQAVR